MEELSDRDHVVVDAYRDPFGSLPVKAHRKSDVDFHDVFGGPPRRSSMQERRRNRADSLDSYASSRERGRGVESRGSRGPWSGLGQKPVFGEVSSPDRRRHLGDDFFSDIFPGSDSVCSSTWKIDGDPFPSTPGSRILSPNRPVPVRCEPFIGGSSLPPQLSLSMKFAKGIDHPTFGSPTHRASYRSADGAPDVSSIPSSPNTSLSSFTSRAVPTIDNLRNNVRDIYRQSPLSRQFSHGVDSSLEVSDSATISMEKRTWNIGTGLEGYSKSNQFHFSIYRWAGNGASLNFPSSSKEGNENSSGLRRLPEVVVQRVDLPPNDNYMSLVTGASKSKTENQDSQAPKVITMERKVDAELMILEDHLPAEFESKYLHGDLIEESGTHNISQKVPATISESRKPDLKNLHQLFNDDPEKEAVGSEDITRKVEEREGLSNGLRDDTEDLKTEQQPGRENLMDHIQVMGPCVQDAPIALEYKMLGGQVKGKVKEFIKIFNNEGSPKCKGTFETQDRSSKGKDRSKSKVDDQVSSFAAKVDEGMKASWSNNDRAFLGIPIAMSTMPKEVEKQDINMNSYAQVINDSSSERNSTLELQSEPGYGSKGTKEGKVEEVHYEDLDGCPVEQLSKDQNEHLQTSSQQDPIKVSDGKVREWSKGREGNIRSLLSTLQYVLWPESGWKPVPLVDIIEGASVKRAYQKALLCLHPDKLQQRGAPMHEKYVAEKVFDMLQEAWNQFNSVSAF